MNKSLKTGFTRRQFLKNTSAAGVAIGFPTIIPSTVLGQNAPSKRITLGCIGLGQHGTAVNLSNFLRQADAQIVAVCDVVSQKAQAAAEKINGQYGNQDCRVYSDFRHILADKSIDAVVISTPDHWHVPMTIMALEAGKDVFSEKPTKAIAEGRTLIEAVEKHQAVFQMGLEDRSYSYYHKMVEWVRNGAIGDLERVEVTLPNGLLWPKGKPAPVPEGTDYNLFVGPAPFMPYEPGLTTSDHWRFVRNFGSGTLLDWGSHQMDTAQLAVNAPEVCPIEVEGTGTIPTDAMSNVPLHFDVDFRYSTGAVVNIKSGGTGIKLFGTKGWVGNERWCGGFKASDPKILRTKYAAGTSKHWPMPPGEHRNFLDCVKSRKKTTYTEQTMHLLHTSLHMGDISIRLGRKVSWDAKKEEFVGDAEANAMRFTSSPRDWQAEG